MLSIHLIFVIVAPPVRCIAVSVALQIDQGRGGTHNDHPLAERWNCACWKQPGLQLRAWTFSWISLIWSKPESNARIIHTVAEFVQQSLVISSMKTGDNGSPESRQATFG